MKQTPVHEQHNPDLLRVIPKDLNSVIEVGCSSGALAREYKKLNAPCHYIGIETDSDYAALAKRHCDTVHSLNIENADAHFFQEHSNCDCWIFGDVLEHLVNPWLLLANIRQSIPAGGCVVACIPNAQHWSIQARLNRGDFRYEKSGLLDKTHLRWFTRITIVEMFNAAGFNIVESFPRIFNEPDREKVLPPIRAMAASIGADPEQAVRDAMPLQYVLRAIPI